MTIERVPRRAVEFVRASNSQREFSEIGLTDNLNPRASGRAQELRVAFGRGRVLRQILRTCSRDVAFQINDVLDRKPQLPGVTLWRPIGNESVIRRRAFFRSEREGATLKTGRCDQAQRNSRKNAITTFHTSACSGEDRLVIVRDMQLIYARNLR